MSIADDCTKDYSHRLPVGISWTEWSIGELMSFRCQCCKKLLSTSYDSDQEHGDLLGRRWYRDQAGLNHLAIVCLECGAIHDCSGSAFRSIVTFGKSRMKIHSCVDPVQLSVMVRNLTDDPRAKSRTVAIGELGLPESVIDVLVNRKILGRAFASARHQVRDFLAANPKLPTKPRKSDVGRDKSEGLSAVEESSETGCTGPRIVRFDRNQTVRWQPQNGELVIWFRSRDIRRLSEWEIVDLWALEHDDTLTITNSRNELPSWIMRHPSAIYGQANSELTDQSIESAEVLDGPNIWKILLGDRLARISVSHQGQQSVHDVLCLVDFTKSALAIGESGCQNRVMNFGALTNPDNPEAVAGGRYAADLIDQMGPPRVVAEHWSIGQ